MMKTMDEQERLFWEYHEKNPGIFKLFTKFSLQMMATGRKRYSAKSIIERIRWHYDLKTDVNEKFKINNNYTSRYAVLLEETRPEFKGFFNHRGGIELTFTRELPLDVAK